MDYSQLAAELLLKMQALRKMKPQKNIHESLQGESFVLHYIAHHGSDVLPGEISSEMDVSSARVAAALNSLENKGLITRQIDRNDRRRILVRLTPEGKETADRHQRKVVEGAAKMLALLGEDDAREYVRITGRLAEMLPQCGEFL